MATFFKKLIKYFKTAGGRKVAVGAVVLISGLVIVIGLLWRGADPASSNEASLSEVTVDAKVGDSCVVRHPVDGVCLGDDQEVGSILAIMIDNHVDARSSAGLNQARLVYEAIAEGTITRLLAFFDSNDDVTRIGAVRSARSYYVSWAEEFGGLYVHVGGSPDALSYLAGKAGVFDVNEFAYGSYFWRDTKRFAPHNVYISTESLRKLIDRREWSASNDYISWQYKEDLPTEDEPTVELITVDYGHAQYDVVWRYDASANEYRRSQGGREQKDESGVTLVAKNVAVMYTKSVAIDDYGRRDTVTIGEGPALVFLDGQAITGTWRRSKTVDRTRFFDDEGNEVFFNPGLTWVQVVPAHFPEVLYE